MNGFRSAEFHIREPFKVLYQLPSFPFITDFYTDECEPKIGFTLVRCDQCKLSVVDLFLRADSPVLCNVIISDLNQDKSGALAGKDFLVRHILQDSFRETKIHQLSCNTFTVLGHYRPKISKSHWTKIVHCPISNCYR